MSETLAHINPRWANSLPKYYTQIDKFNYPPNQNLWRKVTFSKLGGLTVRFFDIEEVFAPKQKNEPIGELDYFVTTRSVLDLSFGNPKWVTLTSELLNAVSEQRTPDDHLRKQLNKRMQIPEIRGYDPMDLDIRLAHSSDEVWLFPTIAVAKYLGE